ncbi:MAG: MOSC domain-containing protein [Betaproteobacteria bacterium]|nr:MOSC domain-containing protein [Betaproteobacteria bacterium]
MSAVAHEVLAVCIGQPTRIEQLAEDSGIFKKPVTGAVALGPAGFAGDAVCDLENHGGAMKAVYAMGTDDYAYWQETLGRELAVGTFGENLLLAGIDSGRMRCGDRLLFPDAQIVVTQPRIPCAKLAVRMNDKFFAKQFMQSEHPGFYCRVARPGSIAAGQSAEIVAAASGSPTIARMFAQRRGEG